MTLTRLNLAAALVVATFVLTHTINHALGLWSLEAAEGARRAFGLLWRSPLGGAALGAALFYHLGYAYFSVFRRSHLRLPALEWVRLWRWPSPSPLSSSATSCSRA